LRREIAALGIYPAIDVLHSVSRLMNGIVSEEHRMLAMKIREMLSLFEKNREIISLGMYVRGKNPGLDEAIDKIDRIQSFLKQGRNPFTLKDTLDAMQKVIDR